MTETQNFSSMKGHIDIIDDDEGLRQSLIELLTFAGYSVKAWSSAEDFLDHPANAAPAVILLDIRMKGMSGLDMHEILKAHDRTIPVIYMSGESTVPQSIKAMKLGAVDFLIKPFTREHLLDAVIAGLEKDRIQMLDRITKKRMEEAVHHLTPREREVLGLMINGFNNSEIMDTLGISLPTAKQYKSQIMKKLGVRSLSQLMKFGKI